MIKYNTLVKIRTARVIAIIRADSAESTEKTAVSCIEGGVNGIEVTYTSQGASEAIKSLTTKFRENNQVVIGAGTVLDVATARLAILSGAAFIVGPNFNLEINKLCNLYQIPYLPGCMTINEIVTALEAGVDVVKIFPSNVVGFDFVKTVKGPLPNLMFMPTGGVNLDNIASWAKLGSFAIGVGSELTSGARTGDYKLVTETAKKFMQKL